MTEYRFSVEPSISRLIFFCSAFVLPKFVIRILVCGDDCVTVHYLSLGMCEKKMSKKISEWFRVVPNKNRSAEAAKVAKIAGISAATIQSQVKTDSSKRRHSLCDDELVPSKRADQNDTKFWKISSEKELKDARLMMRLLCGVYILFDEWWMRA